MRTTFATLSCNHLCLCGRCQPNSHHCGALFRHHTSSLHSSSFLVLPFLYLRILKGNPKRNYNEDYRYCVGFGKTALGRLFSGLTHGKGKLQLHSQRRIGVRFSGILNPKSYTLNSSWVSAAERSVNLKPSCLEPQTGNPKSAILNPKPYSSSSLSSHEVSQVTGASVKSGRPSPLDPRRTTSKTPALSPKLSQGFRGLG